MMSDQSASTKPKRKSYDDKFRASAVVALEAAGYPKTKGVLTKIAKEFDVPHPTLSRWFNQRNNPPPNEVVQEKKEELSDLFEGIARKMLTHAAEEKVIGEMSGKDAVIAAATATDKMRLLRGLPTEIIQIMPSLVAALEQAGLDPIATFNRMMQKAHERIGQKDNGRELIH